MKLAEALLVRKSIKETIDSLKDRLQATMPWSRRGIDRWRSPRSCSPSWMCLWSDWGGLTEQRRNRYGRSEVKFVATMDTAWTVDLAWSAAFMKKNAEAPRVGAFPRCVPHRMGRG